MDSVFRNIERNKIFYEFFLQRKILEEVNKISEVELLGRIVFLGRFAWRNHAGYYTDGRLENILFDYGKGLENYIDLAKVESLIGGVSSPEGPYSTVHVATELGAVGGHTRVLWQLLKRHKECHQVLILTGQSVEDVPDWFVEDIGDVKILSLNSIKSLFERAYALRNLSMNSKRIILHHHPDDGVPVIAFAHDNCPPVLLLNHAHSWFWFGSSVADMVLALSGFHQDFTLKTRPVERTYCLICTQLDDVVGSFTPDDKLDAKVKLNIDPETICIITIGTPEKFVPNTKYNFYKTSKKIVEMYDNVQLYVIGVDDSQNIREKYDIKTNRIHFLGFVNDPSDYYRAADICLDALPQPSFGGTSYAALVGLACPLFKYGVANVFDLRNLVEAKLYDKYIGTVADEKAYLDKLGFLIKNPDIRWQIAEEIKDFYLFISSDDAFAKSYGQLMNISSNLKHSPRKIPSGIYFDDLNSVEIADTSFVQNLSDAFSYFARYLNRKDKIDIFLRFFIKPMHFFDVLKVGVGWLLKKTKTRYFPANTN